MPTHGTEHPEDPVEALRRWETFGAVWEVVQVDDEQVTVSLRRCDGGEEMGRIVSGDPRLRAYVGTPRPSEGAS
jgi:hypothetical protein